MATIEQARAAKTKVCALLAELPEVGGIAIAWGADGWVLRVDLTAEPDGERPIPTHVDAVPVVTRRVGIPTAHGR